MAIPGHKFVKAHFSNNERTIVESYWTDGKETRIEYIEAKEGDPNWENLLTHTDIDVLHEATYKHIKNTQKAFENQAIQIAKDQGILQDFQDKNVINNAIIKTLFEQSEQGNSSDSKNTLFVFKLKLFELDFVKNCKKRKAKSDLRKAENIRQAIKVAIEIFEQSN